MWESGFTTCYRRLLCEVPGIQVVVWLRFGAGAMPCRFTVELLTCRGLVTYYILFYIHLDSRRVSLAGITRHPDQAWMQQMARNATGEAWGFLDQRRYALHDRDAKFCSLFRETLKARGIESIQLPAHSPNLDAYAEHWMRSIKGECKPGRSNARTGLTKSHLRLSTLRLAFSR